MTLIFKSTHVTEAISNLVEQFKNKTNWPKVLTAFVDQVQDLEDMFVGLIEIPDFENQTGVQLDVVGSIVGEDRLGRNDADYIVGIRGRIIVNSSEGTPDDIIDLLTTIHPGTSVIITEYQPAAYTALLTLIVASEDQAHRFGALMKEATAAGVNGQMLYSGVVSSEQFKFDTTDQGFDEGKYTGVI
jgi:hypothetical protein